MCFPYKIGHKGTDGAYYVLDTARVFPPRPPSPSFEAVSISPVTGNPPWRLQDFSVSVTEWEKEVGNLLETTALQKISIPVLSGIMVFSSVEQEKKTPEKFNKGASVLARQIIYGEVVIIPPG